MAGHEEVEGKITKDMFIRDVIREYPETLAFFKKKFGRFSLMLPGTRVETIEFNCAMHDQAHPPILKELNELIGD